MPASVSEICGRGYWSSCLSGQARDEKYHCSKMSWSLLGGWWGLAPIVNFWSFSEAISNNNFWSLISCWLLCSWVVPQSWESWEPPGGSTKLTCGAAVAEAPKDWREIFCAKWNTGRKKMWFRTVWMPLLKNASGVIHSCFFPDLLVSHL